MKWSLSALLVLLLLCGCAKAEPPAPTVAAPPVTTAPPPGNTETTAPTQKPTEPVEPEPELPPVVTTYLENSEIEEKTAGAIRAYDFTQVSWLAPFKDGILVAKAGEQETILQVISGLDGVLSTEAVLPAALPQGSWYQTLTNGFAYYIPDKNQVVILDAQFKEEEILQLPENIAGLPLVSPGGNEVYYCIGPSVYAMDKQYGVSRPVRTNSGQAVSLVGHYKEGSVLACRLTDEQGKESMIFFSAKDGTLLRQNQGVNWIDLGSDRYAALQTEGVVERYIYGKTGEEPVQFHILAEEILPMLPLEGFLVHTNAEEGCQLDFYGREYTCRLTMPAKIQPAYAFADGSTGVIWLLSTEGELLCWNLQTNASADDLSYLGQLYTPKAPDTEGLKACQERAKSLSSQYGVTVRIWEEDLKSNDDYRPTPEYQPVAIQGALDELEAVLSRFPKNFLSESVSGSIRICIVQDVGGERTSVYHWFDGDPFILVSVGMDVGQAFVDGLSYIVDIHILGNSSVVDTWPDLNPAGFGYGVGVVWENVSFAFADKQATLSVSDDRARTFYYAMQPGNEELFKGDTMQKKLLMLCKGIRDAWNLKKSEETFPWEQYLNQSLAYK